MRRLTPRRWALLLPVFCGLLVVCPVLGCAVNGASIAATPPGATIHCGGRSSHREAVRWSWAGVALIPPKEWPPPDADPARGWLAIAPEDTMTLNIVGVSAAPKRVTIEAFDLTDFRERGTEATCLVSWTAPSGGVKSGYAAYSWPVDLFEEGSVGEGPGQVPEAQYALWVTAWWSSKAWSSYCYVTNVAVVSPTAAAVGAARAFFEALWDGDEEAADSVAGGGFGAIDPEGGPWEFSFLGVGWGAPKSAILWQEWPKPTLVEPPEFTATDVTEDARQGLTTVKVTASYVVETSPEEARWPGIRVRFTDSYTVTCQTGEWLVQGYSRSGVPLLADNGTSPGWDPQVSAEVGLVRCGPFSEVGQLLPTASGTRVALVGENFGRYEVWVVEPAKASGHRVLTTPVGEGGPWDSLILVGWTDSDKRLVFLCRGELGDGPFKGSTGTWVATVGVDSGDVESVGYVRDDASDWISPAAITADGSAVVLVAGSCVYLVNLKVGAPQRLVYDIPGPENEAGHVELAHSPDGWSVVWDVLTEDPAQGSAPTVLDARKREPVFIDPAGDLAGQWCGLQGWISNDLLAVGYAQPSELSGLPEYVYADALTTLVLYAPDGGERYRISAGGDDWRITGFAPAPDGQAIAYLRGYPLSPPRELWVWDRESGSVSKLADVTAVSPSEWLSWPVPSIVRLAGVGMPDPTDYVVAGAGGTWTATPKQWAGGPVTRILGSDGESLYGARRLVRGTMQLFQDAGGAEDVFYEGSCVEGSLRLGPNYVLVVEYNGLESKEGYFLFAPLP